MFQKNQFRPISLSSFGLWSSELMDKEQSSSSVFQNTTTFVSFSFDQRLDQTIYYRAFWSFGQTPFSVQKFGGQN